MEKQNCGVNAGAEVLDGRDGIFEEDGAAIAVVRVCATGVASAGAGAAGGVDATDAGAVSSDGAASLDHRIPATLPVAYIKTLSRDKKERLQGLGSQMRSYSGCI